MSIDKLPATPGNGIKLSEKHDRHGDLDHGRQ
jgi:hypothetical protein